MRIIYIHQYFLTPEMGGSTRSYEIAKRLVNKGHEVNLITTIQNPKDWENKKKWKLTNEAGINVYWFPVEYSNKLNFYKRVLAFFKFAFHSFKKGLFLKGDLIYATSTPLTIIIPGSLLAFFKNKPLVLEIRDLWPTLPIAIGALKNPFNIFLTKLLEKFAYKASKKIIALSPGIKKGIIERGISEEKIKVIPNSCDLENFSIKNQSNQNTKFRKIYDIPEENLLVTYAGTFGKINNISYMAELAEKLKNNSLISFLAIGDGADFEKVKNQVEEQKIKNFKIIKSLPKKNMPQVLSASDISLSMFLPLKEMESNSANKFFDGLASGNMILINYGGWQEDILSSSDSGLRLPRNINEAADIVSQLEKNRNKVSDFGKNAKKLAFKKFDRNKLTDKLEKILIEIVSND